MSTFDPYISLVGIPDEDGAVAVELSAYIALTNMGWRPPVSKFAVTEPTKAVS